MKPQMTIRDVAEAAGFSVNTVSRALNDKPDVSVETKRSILKTVKQLGYHPNKLARGLRANKTHTIGLIIADIANPYFGTLVKGAEAEARKHNYSIILQNTDEEYHRELEAVQVMLEERVDGIILSPTQKERGTVEALLKLGMPFVLMGRCFADLDTDYVVADDVQGGYLATEHLIQLGHKKIVLINGPLHISSAKERFQGYCKAFEHYGLKVDASAVVTGAVTMADGYQATKSLLKRKPRPTAIFAFSDFVAFGVMRAIREAGLQIPEDIAVVGYDDNQFASCAEVPLTTIHVLNEKIGATAVHALQEHFTDHHPMMQLRVPVNLVVRRSTCKDAEIKPAKIKVSN